MSAPESYLEQAEAMERDLAKACAERDCYKEQRDDCILALETVRRELRESIQRQDRPGGAIGVINTALENVNSKEKTVAHCDSGQHCTYTTTRGCVCLCLGCTEALKADR